MARLIRAALASLAAIGACGAAPPSSPGVDAPELAALGPDKVGFQTIQLVHQAQPDFNSPDPANTKIVRRLAVDLWYPALPRRGARTATYRATFWAEPPHPPVSFSVPGLAISGAPQRGKRHPLVIVSHGYSNSPAAMTWLTENLASKGYFVAAIHHADPNPYVISAEARAVPNYHRPSDIAFVVAELSTRLGDQIDPANVALIGYSQGGYGVLTAGGVSLDPAGPNMALVPGGLLRQYARGTSGAAAFKVPGVKAIVALAPAGGQPRSAWGAEGLAAITAPLLLIQGDQDAVVDYQQGALAVFRGAVRSNRYLLTYRFAGHAVAHNPVPPEMRGAVWDMDWFEDPIWRQDRINAINLHFITAFLEWHMRGRAELRSYLDVPVVSSQEGAWNASPATPWGAYSPGGTGVTLWKGFQRRHAQGMELRHAAAE